MPYKELVFNNKSSRDLGLVIQTTPEYQYPSRDVTTTHVPGRNGDVITDNKCYNNIERVYSLAKIINSIDPNDSVISSGSKIIEWLNSAGHKYVRLEDDYDPYVYRKACYVENGTINDIFSQALTLTVTFNCKPQRFLKVGETPIAYQHVQTNDAEVPNDYYFEAKPVFKFSGLPVGTNDVTLISVKDSDNNETSLITIRNLEASDGDITIDSENETCTNNQNENINYKVSLNGTNFPVLRKNKQVGGTTLKNKVSVKKYNLNGSMKPIPSYNSIISNANTVAESGYSTKEMTINDMADKLNIPSHDSLVASLEQKYQAQSFFSLVDAKCEEGVAEGSTLKDIIADKYTIPNVNDALSATSETVSFSDENVPLIGSWYELNDGKTTVTITKSGFICKNNSEGIIHVSGSAINPTSFNVSTITRNNKNVTFYQQYNDSTLQATVNIRNDLPLWLEIVQRGGTTPSPVSGFAFNAKSSSDVSYGYVWTDKKNIFDTAKWTYISSNSGLELNTYSWNSQKGVFTADNAGISAALGNTTNTVYTYKYIRKGNDNYPCIQYDAVNGFSLFKVEINGMTSSSSIIVKGTQTKGFYRVTSQSWSKINSGVEFSTQVSPANSFVVEYLSKVPAYDDFMTNWPDWLEPCPYGTVTATNEEVLTNINALLKFKIKKDAWYRYHEEIKKSDGTTDYRISRSEYLDAGDYFSYYPYQSGTLTVLQVNRKNACRLSMIDSPSDKNPDNINPYPYDRYFKVNNGAPRPNPPSWLSYSVTMNVTIDGDEGHVYEAVLTDYVSDNYYRWRIPDLSNRYIYVEDYWAPTINDKVYELSGGIAKPVGRVKEEPIVEYKMNADGYIRWDANTAWKRVYNNDVLLTSNFKEITTFYYLFNMPEYDRGNDKYKAELSGYQPSNIRYLTRYSENDTTISGVRYFGWKADSSVPGPNTDEFYTRSEQLNIGDLVYFYNTYLDTMNDDGEIIDVPTPGEIEFNFIVEPHYLDGNPTDIVIKIAPGYDGYYKLETAANWKYFSANEEIATALVTEQTKILSLDVSAETISDVTLTVTPNWWTL